MSKPEFVYVTYIATTPEKLWEALTDGDFSEKYWMGCRAESDWKVGSPVVYSIPKEDCIAFTGEVLEFDPPRRLSYTFNDVKGGSGETGTRVVFDIEPLAEVVKLTVKHDQFIEGSKLIHGISGGWPLVLSGLKSLLENGTVLNAGAGEGRCSGSAKA